MTTYEVRLINGRGLVATLQVSQDQYILDVVRANGIELPRLCGRGTCPACIGFLVSGQVDQSAQSYLGELEMQAGLVTLCVARPRSDCTIKTHLIN
jgi:ferredoxin